MGFKLLCSLFKGKYGFLKGVRAFVTYFLGGVKVGEVKSHITF